MSVLRVSAMAEQFLEGEVRLNTSGTPTLSCSSGICSSLTLSSGTEDYFLGTYYFNRGGYHNALAGCTHLKSTARGWEFSGYRRCE
jgi:hypothetical protein